MQLSCSPLGLIKMNSYVCRILLSLYHARVIMPFAESVPLDHPTYQHSLIWELPCLLIGRIRFYWLISNEAGRSDYMYVQADLELQYLYMANDKQLLKKVNPWLADQPAHPCSLIRELHCLCICRIWVHWLIIRQWSSQVRLCRYTGCLESTLSQYGRNWMLPLVG